MMKLPSGGGRTVITVDMGSAGAGAGAGRVVRQMIGVVSLALGRRRRRRILIRRRRQLQNVILIIGRRFAALHRRRLEVEVEPSAQTAHVRSCVISASDCSSDAVPGFP